MNRIITLPKLVVLLSEATGYPEDVCKKFILDTATVVLETLAVGDFVKIKGIGTFRAAMVAGERTAEFVPDPVFANRVNAQFSAFEPIELSEYFNDGSPAEAPNQPQHPQQQPATPQRPSVAEPQYQQQPEPGYNPEPVNPLWEKFIRTEPAAPQGDSTADDDEDITQPTMLDPFANNNESVAPFDPSQIFGDIEPDEDLPEPQVPVAPVSVPYEEPTLPPEHPHAPYMPKPQQPAPQQPRSPYMPPEPAPQQPLPQQPRSPYMPPEPAPQQPAPQQPAPQQPRSPYVPPEPVQQPLPYSPYAAQATGSTEKEQDRSTGPTDHELHKLDYYNRKSDNPYDGKNAKLRSSRHKYSAPETFNTPKIVAIAVVSVALLVGAYFMITNYMKHGEVPTPKDIVPTDTIIEEDYTDDDVKLDLGPASQNLYEEEEYLDEDGFEEEPQVVYDTITRTRRIVDMANDYYGRKEYWVYIYMENEAVIGNPNHIRVGTRLVIPPREKYDVSTNEQENLKNARKKITQILTKYPPAN